MANQDASGNAPTCATQSAYLFEAKGIQRYIFDSGPLRDLVGASDLVGTLASSAEDDAISSVLRALGVENEVRFSRRAGGAFLLHGDEAALKKVRALWRLTAGVSRPGLEMSDSWGKGVDDMAALRDAYQNGSSLRFNTAAELPPTGNPYTAFNPRTGRVATHIFVYSGDSTVADVITGTQRLHADSLDANDSVAKRFLPAAQDGKSYCFPRNLEPDEEDQERNPLFPFRGEDQRIGVVHADLSGLGEIFSEATKKVKEPADVSKLATSIQTAIETAAKEAARELLLPYADKRNYGQNDMKHVIPARPVVLGGDDVTILVRADLALPFAAKLLLAIEVETANIADKTPHLSACAGVAIARAGQPFLMVNALAESLCSTAKKEAKKNDREAPYPSMLAFHIAQSTLQEEYNVILDREKTGPDGCLRITANPIEVIRLSQQPKTVRPSWSALIELARALDVEPRGRGKLIELRDLLVAEGRSKMAHDYWRRFIKVLKSQNEQALVGIDKALKTLGVADLASLPIVEKHGPEHCYCPVPDALELIDLGSLGALK